MSRGIGELLRTLQAVRERLGELSEALRERAVEGSAADGLVRVKINGRLELLDLRIDPKAAGDHRRLERLVSEALREALQGIRRALMEEAGRAAGALLPRFSELP